mgnify:FL=1
MKKPPEKQDEMEAFQQALYDLASKHMEGDDPSTLFMCCGVMLKTCIEMYLSVLNDEAVEKVLQDAARSIPVLRDKIENELSKITVH